MPEKKNKFLIFRRWLEHDISNKVKTKTDSDLFDWICLIILFGGGTVFIFLLMYFNVIDLNGLIQGFILWFTAFAIFRYTKETYWLKKISQKQYITSIRPYLRLQWETKGNLVLVNEGKGVAVDIKFKFVDNNESENSITFNNVSTMSAGGQTRSFVPDSINQNESLNPEKKEYKIEANYKDIEGRKYYTVFKTNLKYNDKFEILKQEKQK